MLTITFEFDIGDQVWDSLTKKKAKIIGINWEKGKKNKNDPREAAGCCGYWIDNDYLDGGRHPWEIN